jgi:hypothetical protein
MDRINRIKEGIYRDEGDGRDKCKPHGLRIQNPKSKTQN